MSSVRWGAFAPQGWKLEYAGTGAEEAWARTVAVAELAERLGYAHLWVYDHVETVPRREPAHVFEAFTTLAALSQRTATIRLGQMVTCASYRNPALLAKQAACLDVMSGGRLILGLGAGWYEREYRAYGYEFRPPRERLRVLEETLTVVRRLWTEPTVSFAGSYVQLDGAYCDPKPVQALPPVWVGGGGEQVTLRIAARHADATNFAGSLAEFRHKNELVDRYAAEAGRDPASVTRTWAPDCLLFETAAAYERWLDGPAGGNLWGKHVQEPREWAAKNLVGTVEQVVEKAAGYVEAGATEIVPWFRDYPATTSLERLVTEVAPQLSTAPGPTGG